MHFTYGKSIIRDPNTPRLGYSQSLDIWIEVKPMRKLRTEFSFDRYWLWERKGGEELYDVFTLWNKITYQFSKRLSIRLITQYYSYTGKIQIDPLLSYELNPFTVFYFGSNHNVQDFGAPCGVRETNHQIFLKLRYQFKTTPEDILGKVVGIWKK